MVAINYRLNIFGQPNARGLPITDQNFGLYDQRAAVEWISENIAAFGGDPSKIALWGQIRAYFTSRVSFRCLLYRNLGSLSRVLEDLR